MSEHDTSDPNDPQPGSKDVAQEDQTPEREYGDNADPRYEPNDMERRDLAPPGSIGTIKSGQPLQDIPPEQKQAIAQRYERLQQQQERDELKADLKRGVRGEERSRPFLAKRDFDRNGGLDI